MRLLVFAALACLLPGYASGPLPGIPHEQDPGTRLLFTIPEHDLYPENVAFDEVTGDFFLSSMGHSRVLRIHPDGTYEDFVGGMEPRLQSSVGMKVDAQRRRLWVCTGRYTLFGGSRDGPPLTGVLLFDLDNGALLQEWLQDQPSPAHIFNDLVIASNGDAYVTTTLFGRVYRASAGVAEMELILETPDSHNNGITLDPGERYLFLTLDRTISRLDLQTGELKEVPAPEEAALGSDGIYFVDGSLVVVKPRFRQIARLFLNESLDAVDRFEVLADGHPDFVYPTTGALKGDTLVFVATSFADSPRDPESTEQHGDVLIHQIPLGGG